MFNKYLLPPDVFFRHSVIARAVGHSKDILDVGGSLGELRKFLPHTHIATADVVRGGDILFNGKKLPLSDKSYETVVSVDTLEHIPQNERLPFVKELRRVAQRQVILLAPYGSVEHSIAEKRLANSYEQQGKVIPNYLREHIKFSLPDDGFLRDLKKEFRTTTIFCGRLWFDRVNFAIHTFEVSNGKVNQLLYRGKYLWNVAANFVIIPFLLRLSPRSSTSSRFLAKIERT